jgi:hypothetical protein
VSEEEEMVDRWWRVSNEEVIAVTLRIIWPNFCALFGISAPD